MVSERMPNRVAMLRGRVDRVIDTASEDLTAAVMEETDGKGVDVILPATPEVRVDDALMRLLSPNGRLCIFSGRGRANTKRRSTSGRCITGRLPWSAHTDARHRTSGRRCG